MMASTGSIGITRPIMKVTNRRPRKVITRLSAVWASRHIPVKEELRRDLGANSDDRAVSPRRVALSGCVMGAWFSFACRREEAGRGIHGQPRFLCQPIP